MRKWTTLFLGIIFSTQLSAAAIEFIGTMTIDISSKENINQTKKHLVAVQKIRLSDSAQQVLKERLKNIAEELIEQTSIAQENVPARLI